MMSSRRFSGLLLKRRMAPMTAWFGKSFLSTLAQFILWMILLLTIVLTGRLLYSRMPYQIGSVRIPYSYAATELPYAPDDEEFLHLVNKKYDDEKLVEWEPAPPIHHDPTEPGHLGKPVILPAELKESAKKRFPEHMINVVASDLVSFNRTLPDIRHEKCHSIQYPKRLPPTSVVIIFHNEAFSVLMRTVWNIYSKSPRALVKEIILVDDASDHEELHQHLEQAVKDVPVKVVILRMMERAGLIQAKILAAKYVTAPVMTFLDAHVECHAGWLEPLLSLVAEDRTTIANPVMDQIRYDSLEFISSGPDIFGMFDWTFIFNWTPIPERELNRTRNDPTAPIRTPAMVGGLFSIDHEYFYKLGTYDGGMRIWAGDDVEMSIRTWSCGGTILVTPCSRVAHLTRANRIYVGSVGWYRLLIENSARFVDVWTDEWKEFFYTVFPHAMEWRSADLDDRKLLRKNLRCKSFKWFLKNIYPESTLNLERYHLGEVESTVAEGLCLSTNGGKKDDVHLKLELCGYTTGNSVLLITKRHEIRSRLHCLEAVSLEKPMKFSKCHGRRGSQKFAYSEKTRSFEFNDTGHCLSVENDASILLKPCDGSIYQQWDFVRIKRVQSIK